MALTNTAALDGANVKYSIPATDVTVLTDDGDKILTVTVKPSALRIRDGKALTYTVSIQNTDTNIDATGVQFTDTYASANFTVTNVSSSVSGLTFNTATAGTITADAKFDVAKSSTVTITIEGTVKYTA